METFVIDRPSSKLEDVSASTIAESSVDAVIDAMRSEMKSTRPPSESAALLDVDWEMDVVAAAHRLFSNILALRVAALGRQRNAMLPINRLPTELIARIFSTLVDPMTWSVSMLSSLASVCSRWWRIIVSTPSLWTTAKISERPDLVVKKSKALSFHVHEGNWHHSEGTMRHFTEVVGPHAHRWRTVYIQTPFIECVNHYLSSSLPQLEVLSLGFREGREGATERLTLGDTPKLRHLRLYRIVMNWDSITRISLETLCLMGLRQAHVPTMQQLYQILVSSPQLQQLTLRDLDDPVDAERFSAELISLKRLNKVEIQDTGEHTLVGIVNMLQAENLSSLTTRSKIRPDSNILHLANFLRPSSTHSPLPSVLRNRGLKSVYVKIRPRHFKLSDKEILGDISGACLAVGFQGIGGSEVLYLLGPPDRGYDVNLDATACELRDEELIRVLRLIDPSVLRVGRDHLQAVTEALSKVPASPETWFCPNLRELCIRARTSLDPNMVARVVQLRHGLTEAGAPPGCSRLLVYDAKGRVFNLETVSFEHSSSPSMDTSGHQNVV